MTKILGIIQARMGSTRLPRKVMLPLLDKPVIWRIYERLCSSKNIDQTCISTSTNSLDDKIEEFAKKENISYFRGSEEMIVNRLLNTAKKFKADAIVRVTGDCPLTDPKIIDQLIQIYLEKQNCDFVSNTIERTFPHGLDTEVISTDFLEVLDKKLQDAKTQESFIKYVNSNTKKFSCFNFAYNKNLSYLRWTLDYNEDYIFINKIYQNLYSKIHIFDMNDILNLLEKMPQLSNINKQHMIYH